ncbi:hypothetical protein Tco_0271950 [Tanacetum coccineum]
MATAKLDAHLQGTQVDQTKYRTMIGGLMYLNASRPDTAFATFVCARYQARPTEKHLKEVERIFRYLRQSINMGLWYSKDSGFELIAYSDADHAGCNNDCKSTSGGIQFLGDKLVSWSSRKQDCTATSTAEAEYALVEAYKTDKLILDTYGDTVSFKRCRDDEDKNEEPSVGSNQVSKRRRARKEPKTTRANAHRKDLEEPAHQEFDIGATEEQSDEETSQHPDWFQKPAKIPTLDHDWNKTLPAVHKPVQPWLSNLAREEGPRESFDELMDTPLDFSAFMMNRLKIDTLTPELLAGPTFKLMKGTCKSLVELEDFFKEVYKATTDQLDWHNPEGQQYPHDLESAHDVYSKRRIIAVTKLQIVEWYGYKHLDWITVRRDDDKLYTFKVVSSPNHPTFDIEDAFSSNFSDYIPASPDYVPASPGKTYSSSSNNSFGLVPIASPTLSLFHDDPYMKVMHAYYAKESPILPPTIVPPSSMLSSMFNPQELFLPKELLPLKKRGRD